MVTTTNTNTTINAAGETFRTWIKRVTEEGTFDLSSIMTLVDESESYWTARGKTLSINWWAKLTGRNRGKGTLPRTMKHPATGARFVFPILTLDRSGLLVDASEETPACSKCGREMERKNRKDNEGDLFACTGYPSCKTAIVAWDSIEGAGPKAISKPKAPEVTKSRPNVDALKAGVKRIIRLARSVTKDHGMTLDFGYRTVKHLVKLAVITNSADEAWRVYIDGRVSAQEREKFNASGLPVGSFARPAKTDDNPAWYSLAARLLDARLPVYLTGPSGTGKTRFAGWYADRVEKNLSHVVGDESKSGRELWVARRDASAGSTSTVPGPATVALTEGNVLLIDEADAFDPNSLLPLNAPLNGDKKVHVSVIGEIEVNPELRIIAAANTNGRTPNRKFAGRNRLDGAFLNRFAAVIDTDFETSVDDKVADEAADEVIADLGL